MDMNDRVQKTPMVLERDERNDGSPMTMRPSWVTQRPPIGSNKGVPETSDAAPNATAMATSEAPAVVVPAPMTMEAPEVVVTPEPAAPVVAQEPAPVVQEPAHAGVVVIDAEPMPSAADVANVVSAEGDAEAQVTPRGPAPE